MLTQFTRGSGLWPLSANLSHLPQADVDLDLDVDVAHPRGLKHSQFCSPVWPSGLKRPSNG
jgi:hypothetical protein